MYNRVCRACLTTQTSFTYFIFENVSPETYCFCTSVQVSKDEQLPRGVCNSCYELLNKYSEFKQTCLQSQATLLNLAKDFKIEVDIKTDCDPDGSQEDEIKTEIPDFAVKIEDKEIDHDYTDDIDHHESLESPEEKHFKRKAKKIKLKQHQVIKAVKKKFIYTCDVCQKKFNFKERFEAHKLEHEGKITTIHCLPCNKTFATWSGLKRHNENDHTQVSLESLKCATCGKIYKSRQTLKIHEKVHEDRKLIMCDVCGRGLTSAVVLKAHLETHKEHRERSFACDQCGKKFFTKTILRTHVTRRHSGRKFICQN
ncbi:hypothetical protein PYW07_006927 [Mythimna separata]|uniref:Uncharacterized protein n=1 Tax=Mythimna separata TaxID=271217 RepID=A0AAD7Z341_MYTSE|nr:hypothetical protein PYW07_006927 [Mythimna separata]